MDYSKLVVNGTEYPLCLEAGSIRILDEQFDLDIFQMFQKFQNIGKITSYLPKIAYAAMCCYCSKENVAQDFTYDEVLRWFDGQPIDEVKKLSNLVTDAYLTPLLKVTSGEVKNEDDEPFHMEGHAEDLPGADVHASVGTGSVYAQRPHPENAGVR